MPRKKKVASILTNIKKKHVSDVIRYIDSVGHVPRRRNSTTYALRTRQGGLYPPKYVISLAAQRVLGRELKPDEHSGGAQSNKTLERLGFKIVRSRTTLSES
jgi:5-methylcytosine-specific restriction protein A